MPIITNKIGTLEYLTGSGISAPHCFTTRFGGVSQGYLSSLNIGIHRGDALENVLKNYEILANALDFRPENAVLSHQTHTDIVLRVGKTHHGAGLFAPELPECDALITNEPGTALVIFTADCTPILLHDPVTGAVGAAHAGWRGTAADIAGKTVAAMVREFGCEAAHIRAAIGPNIGPCCFETDADVPHAMVDAFGPVAEKWIRQSGHKYYVNLKEINALALRRSGVTQIDISTDCTACQCNRFWSHRITGGNRGSQGAIIVCKGGKSMKRLIALALCGILTAGLLSGCNSSGGAYTPTGDGLTWGDATTPTSPVTEQKISLPYYPDRGLNPYQSGDYVNKNIFSLVYQGLFAVDAQYNVYPVLCKSYTISKDMKTYVFYPDAATFPDGEPLTAADVEASLKTARESELYKGRFGYVKTIGLTDDGGVRITLDTPCENLPLLLDVPILKKSQQTADRPLGTGPYLYEMYNDSLRLRRRTDWWCAAMLPVTAEHITLVEGQSPAHLRDEFEFNGLGLVSSDPGSSSYVDFHSDYELWDSENGLFLYLGCNTKSTVLSNQTIRSALTFAIDRDAIAEEFYHDFAYSAVLAASPQSPVYSQALAQKYGYAPEKLTQALAEAELSDVQVKLLLNTDDSVRLRAGRAIARMLTAAGLKVITDERNGESYRKALQQRNFDLYLGQTRLSANMDLSEFFDTNGELNYGSMSNAALYGLCLESLANSGNFYTLHQKIAEDGRLTPILFRSNAVFAQRGAFSNLTPARDNVFFYHLGRSLSDAKA